MNETELMEFIRKNLKIKLSNNYAGYENYMVIAELVMYNPVSREEEIISESRAYTGHKKWS